jgi:hypothetical protein
VGATTTNYLLDPSNRALFDYDGCSGQIAAATGSDAPMKRGAVAFFVAPLAVPLLLLPWLSSGHLAPGWMLTAIVIAALVSYAGTLVLGVPAYFLLRARRLTAAWIAGVAGFVIGALMWLVFSVLFPLSLDQGLSGVRFALTDLHTLKGVIWPGGVLGAIVGALFWVIARPDRQPS